VKVYSIIFFIPNYSLKVKVWVINIDKDKIEYYPRQLELLFDSLEKDNMTRPKDVRIYLFIIIICLYVPDL